MISALEYVIISYDLSPDFEEILKVLLDFGVDFNLSEPTQSFNPLILAVNLHEEETSLKLLKMMFKLAQNMHIDKQDRIGNSALDHACIAKKFEVGKYLLE